MAKEPKKTITAYFRPFQDKTYSHRMEECNEQGEDLDPSLQAAGSIYLKKTKFGNKAPGLVRMVIDVLK